MALVLDGDNGIIGVLATNTDGDVIFDTNTLFVDAVENKVGIGTITPVRQLHLASSVPSIRLEDTDVSGAYNDIVHLSTGELSIRVDHGNVQSNSSLSFLIDADEKMRINTDGNVGIGTTNPQRKLVVYQGDSGQAQIQFQNVTTGSVAGDGFGVGLDSSEKGFIWNYEGNDTYIGGAGGTSITIQNGGNVGIGTDNPGAKLEVNGTVTATAFAGDGDNITGVAKISNASTSPSVGAAGTMYYNTTAGVLYISNGAAWVQSYKNPANGSSSGSAAEYGSDIIALGLGAGLYWLTGRVAANRPAQQVYVDADGWMLFYRHAGTGGGYNATYEIIGDTLGEGAVGTLTSPTQGLTDAGSSTAAGSRGVARLATDFIRSLGGDSAANNVYRITTGSVTAYITDAQWWSTADGSSDGYGRTSISCGNSYANRRASSGSTPDVDRPMGTYNIYGPANVIPWYHGNNYSGGYNPAEGWHISTTCWVREF